MEWILLLIAVLLMVIGLSRISRMCYPKICYLTVVDGRTGNDTARYAYPMGYYINYSLPIKGIQSAEQIWITDQDEVKCELFDVKILPVESNGFNRLCIDFEASDNLIKRGPYWIWGTDGSCKEKIIQMKMECKD